jgi:hypothetical protein
MKDGVGTPEFDGRVVALHGTELVDRVDGHERMAPVTTLRAAGEFFDVQPGPPPLWTPTTSPRPGDVLDVSEEAVRALAGWLQLVDDGLADFAPDAARTLWPEHFDLAIELDGATYGGSPGDDDHAGPYVYVVPPEDPVPDHDRTFWNARFGASRPYDAVHASNDIAAFFHEAQQRLQAR